MVLISADLCLNLNELSKIHQKPRKNLTKKKTNLHGLSCNCYDIIPPDVPRLILVASVIVSGDEKGRSLANDDLSPGTLKHSRNNK